MIKKLFFIKLYGEWGKCLCGRHKIKSEYNKHLSILFIYNFLFFIFIYLPTIIYLKESSYIGIFVTSAMLINIFLFLNKYFSIYKSFPCYNQYLILKISVNVMSLSIYVFFIVGYIINVLAFFYSSNYIIKYYLSRIMILYSSLSLLILVLIIMIILIKKKSINK